MFFLKQLYPTVSVRCRATLFLMVSVFTISGFLFLALPVTAQANVELGTYAKAAASYVCPQYRPGMEGGKACKAYLHFRIDKSQNPVSALGNCKTEFCKGHGMSPGIRALCEKTCDKMKENDN